MLFNHDISVILVDTPVSDTLAAELLRWTGEHQKAKISDVIITHWQNDRLGGLAALHKSGTNSYAYELT